MSDDKKFDVERPFVVDGIKEYDNPLPPWFIALFIGTIVFGVCYMLYYEVFTSESIQHELAIDEGEYKRIQARLDDNESGGDLETELKNPHLIAAGKEIYSSKLLTVPWGRGTRGCWTKLNRQILASRWRCRRHYDFSHERFP